MKPCRAPAVQRATTSESNVIRLAEHDIIARVRRGDLDAFADLVLQYKDKAMSLAVGLLKDHHDAEDAVQESFVKAFRGLDRFNGSAQFGTWFYRIVYNTCLNVLDARNRRPGMDVIDEETLPVWIEPSLFDAFDREDVERVLRETLQAMPPLYAAVMDLFYVQECTHEQIVRITGMPVGTIKTRLHRGRAMLRDALTAKYPEIMANYGERS